MEPGAAPKFTGGGASWTEVERLCDAALKLPPREREAYPNETAHTRNRGQRYQTAQVVLPSFPFGKSKRKIRIVHCTGILTTSLGTQPAVSCTFAMPGETPLGTRRSTR